MQFIYDSALTSSLERMLEILERAKEGTGHYSRRGQLKFALSLQRTALKIGTRAQRRTAERRILGFAKLLSRYGHQFGPGAAAAADQLLDAAKTWSLDRLHLLEWAVLCDCNSEGDDRDAWRTRRRVLGTALHTVAITTRRFRWLAALRHMASGFFGHDKADLRNNP